MSTNRRDLASMLEHYGRDSHAYAYLALGGTAPNALMYHLGATRS